MSARRQARAKVKAEVPRTRGRAALLLGPCTVPWGANVDDLFGAWHAWEDARDEWATANGIDPYREYGRLPTELHDRAPFRPRDEEVTP